MKNLVDNILQWLSAVIDNNLKLSDRESLNRRTI